ncbi:uncharacterized protein METZ01_LOCUS126646, partial [marine metagenome]
MGILPDVDPDGLLEYSVIFSDRSLNMMSMNFRQVMQDISKELKNVYNAQSTAIVPGSGTFGMEAIARQFGNGEKCLMLRNGWFAFRFTEIFRRGKIASEVKPIFAIEKENAEGQNIKRSYSPPPLKTIVDEILSFKPKLVYATHVETSTGIIMPDEYIKGIGEATKSIGGLFVLDCVASGSLFVDMEMLGVDLLLTAPQKGWSSTPCAGVIMLNKNAREMIEKTTSSSYSCDLHKWLTVMESYEGNNYTYHTTFPTDGLKIFRENILEIKKIGYQKTTDLQIQLGQKMRKLTEDFGYVSVAAEGYKAPTVIVNYTSEEDMKSGKKFADLGVQIAAGMPLEIGEPSDFMSFRIGLFGIDKLLNIDRTVENFK